MRWARRISDETSVGRAVELYRCAWSIRAKVDASAAIRSNFAAAFRLSAFVSACTWPMTSLRSRWISLMLSFMCGVRFLSQPWRGWMNRLYIEVQCNYSYCKSHVRATPYGFGRDARRRRRLEFPAPSWDNKSPSPNWTVATRAIAWHA